MSAEGEKDRESEAPKVFRIAQLPVSTGATMDRRTFVKGTVATVGAAALVTVLGGCESGGGDSCVCNTVCPCESVGACACDVVACQCQWGCDCHTVCPCEAVSACACHVVQTNCTPESDSATVYATWVGNTCTCNTVAICTCEGVCSCVGHCTCNTHNPCTCQAYHPCSCQSDSHYWYPN